MYLNQLGVQIKKDRSWLTLGKDNEIKVWTCYIPVHTHRLCVIDYYALTLCFFFVTCGCDTMWLRHTNSQLYRYVAGRVQFSSMY